jgi:predicted transposase YdaD
MKQGGSSYVYALFEHKSYPEPLISLHLLRYMIRIWEQALKQGVAKPLPPIIPIVGYHGRTRWKIGLEFFDLFNDLPEELKSFAPGFQYLLCDLSRYSDEEIKGAVRLKAAFILLRHIFLEDLRERLPEIIKLLESLVDKRSGLEYLETVLRYVASGSDQIKEEDLESAVREVLREKGGDIMPTVAEQWIEQGMQQGVLQSAREAVIDILEARFEVVPEAIVNRLNEIYEPSLLKIFRRKAVKVMSLEEFEQIIDLMMK